jgi:hypothetical protein
MALDVRELAAPEVAGSEVQDRVRETSAHPRGAGQPGAGLRRSGAAASEMVTMIVVLAAWAVIAGYLFGHAAEGLLVDASAGSAVVAAPAVRAVPA